MFKEHPPKFLYEYSPEGSSETIYVAVYEEYEKQINSSVTLTCIVESLGKHNKIVLKKTGGRMGFRLPFRRVSNGYWISQNVTTLQEEQPPKEAEEE